MSTFAIGTYAKRDSHEYGPGENNRRMPRLSLHRQEAIIAFCTIDIDHKLPWDCQRRSSCELFLDKSCGIIIDQPLPELCAFLNIEYIYRDHSLQVCFINHAMFCPRLRMLAIPSPSVRTSPISRPYTMFQYVEPATNISLLSIK